MKKGSRSFWLMAVLVVAAAFFCSRYCFQLLLIQGESMSPAYHNLELTVLSKMQQEYLPGDVIAFRCDGLHTVLVKRVIAEPGDLAQIQNGTLYINDRISSVYPQEGVFAYSGILSEEIALKDDEYLVVGDNLEKSKDSRYEIVGIISREMIIGKVLGSK